MGDGFLSICGLFCSLTVFILTNGLDYCDGLFRIIFLFCYWYSGALDSLAGLFDLDLYDGSLSIGGGLYGLASRWDLSLT